MFHVIVAVIAVFGALWALAVWVVGGFSFTLAGLCRSVARSAASARRCARGGRRLCDHRRPVAVAASHQSRLSWSCLSLPQRPASLAIRGRQAGADSYAYVSQANLWLHRNLSVAVPLAGSAPWPERCGHFRRTALFPRSPRPELVPVTAPGLPLMMAAAKALAGHCAMFLVTPLSGAMLVWFTFLIGRRIGSDALGVSAAWLTATSPAVLAMLVSPMSDVPAAALWAAALRATLGNVDALCVGGRRFCVSGDIGAAEPRAARGGTWCCGDSGQSREQRTERHESQRYLAARRFRSPAAMVLGVVPGCLFIAWVNNALYGSPLSSGYGSLSSLFSTSNVVPNVERYGGWLIESQTPLFALGGIAVLFPIRAIWRTRERQRAALLLGASAATVWVLYLIYTPYDAWWFLRFLLPSWPALCVGTAAVVLRLADLPHRAFRAGAFAILAVDRCTWIALRGRKRRVSVG